MTVIKYNEKYIPLPTLLSQVQAEGLPDTAFKTVCISINVSPYSCTFRLNRYAFHHNYRQNRQIHMVVKNK